MTDPAIMAALITAAVVVALALANLMYRFGQLSAQVSNLRRDATRRNDENSRQSKERYDGIILRLARLENHFISAAGDVGDD